MTPTNLLTDTPIGAIATTGLAELPPVLWVVGGVALLGIVITLVDLQRHDVEHLPRAAWAAIVVLVSFPIGALLYLTLGRVPGPRVSAGAPESAAPHRLEGPALRELDPWAQATTTAGAATAGATTAAVSAERPAIVTTQRVGKDYGDIRALHGVDVRIPRGATYGLIGPNGAGKTTMLSILAGLRHPTVGSIHLDVPRDRVGVVIDTPQFEPWLSAREVVDLARNLTASPQPGSRVDEVLEEVGLTAARDRRIGGFSRGMLQRVGLAAALVGRPELLILDEPSAALDPAGRREVLDLIGRLAGDTTVILSTHVLADVQQVCDVVGVIDRGELRYQGPIGELLARTSSAYLLQVRADTAELRRALEGRPWVTEVIEPAPGRLRLVVSDATRAEVEVPALVADLGLGLAGFTPATDLESAFLELTS